MSLQFTNEPHISGKDLDLKNIALHYPVKTKGDDQLASGDVVCLSLEDEPSARVVGYIKDPDYTGMRVIVRMFAKGDGWIPTGEYRKTGMFWPWQAHAKVREQALADSELALPPSRA